jgi:hypothetical protein
MNTSKLHIHPGRGRKLILIIAALASLQTVTAALAQSFELVWTSIDGGGCTSTGGETATELTATIGQLDASTLAGGAFELTGGFLAANTASETVVTGACCYGGACSETTAEACVPFICNVADHLPASFAGCFGDVDGNGVVNAGDRGFVSANVGQHDPDIVCRFDMDGNGVVNAADRGFVSANIGMCTPLPEHQNGSGLNQGIPDPRFGAATHMGGGTTCAEITCE